MTTESLEEIAARLLVIEHEAMKVAELAHTLFNDVLDIAREDSVE